MAPTGGPLNRRRSKPNQISAVSSRKPIVTFSAS